MRKVTSVAALLVAIATALPSAILRADGPPESVTMANGEVMYVTGHEYTDRMIDSGSYINPACWEDGTVPTLEDKVWIPEDVRAQMHCDMFARSIVCEGHMDWGQDAYLKVSTITGINATWTAGTELAPVEYRIDWFGTDFEPGDTGQFGNGFVWAGPNAVLQQYGTIREDQPGDEWFYSNGNRGDGQYVIGDPGDVVAKVNLDANGIQWLWDGTGPRPHSMCMHMGSGSHSEGRTIRGFGRTDKSRPLGDDNKAGRYNEHVHRSGPDSLHTRRHEVYADSEGWGLTNHSSNVIAVDCTAVDCDGAGFVCESANEFGGWVDCTAIGIRFSQDIQENYLRAPIYDRWFEGQGFVGSAQVSIENCSAVDCGTGFAWANKAPVESIAGESVVVTYPDGPRNGRTESQPQRPCLDLFVQGYENYGLEIEWVDTEASTLVVDGLIALDGQHHQSAGIYASYTGGHLVKNALIDSAAYGVYHKNISPAPFTYEAVTITGVGQGVYTRDNGGQSLTFTGCDIQASEIGIPLQATIAHYSDRVWTLNDTTLTAPIPWELDYRPEPWAGLYFDNPKGPVVNEIWIDGERVHFPWQTPEE